MRATRFAVLLGVLFLLAATPAFGQEKKSMDETMGKMPNSVLFSGAGLAAGLGMGLTIIGAGWGLGRIGATALESMARQPEVAARIQTAMIIVAAMLEGATLASVILCYLVAGSARF
jgi:F-type H+-transporting ATPase subunit c